jgi:ribonuclease HII
MSDDQIPFSEEFTRQFPPGAIEEQTYGRGFKCVAGLDEVGRGPLAGPVVAAAVVLPRGFLHPDIKDSKLLTPGQRDKLVPLIERSAVTWALGIVGVEEIDRVNILTASLLAMVKAVRALRPRPDCLLIDGNQLIPRALFRFGPGSGNCQPKQRAIVKGDQLCLSISAASILAKVARDAMMVKLDKSYPEYGFASHKGYSCMTHFEALRRFGPSPVHRKSFAPVRIACAEMDGETPDLFSLKENE